MNRKKITTGISLVCAALSLFACSLPVLVQKNQNQELPSAFGSKSDSASTAAQGWRAFFNDANLAALIDSALANNQELNIVLQEIGMSENEIEARKGEYLPFVTLGGGMGIEKAARYTQLGASEATTDIKPGKEMPEPLGDFKLGAYARWEADIWHKLRNARKAAVHRYLASVEGRNFMVTNLVGEIATSYYELLALDNQLLIVEQNIGIQQNALRMVKLQKEATKVTELAVKRFEAQLLNTQSMQFEIRQRIVETENRINVLVGRFPQPVERDHSSFSELVPARIHTGTPAELLGNRADIRQAEQELAAAKLDIQVARASFYPSLGLSANFGIQAFNPAYLAKLPESLFSTLIGDMAGPIVNKKAIRAGYLNANARQIQAIYKYEQTVLNAFAEVVNQVSKIDNLERSYDMKSKEVNTLNESVTISNRLFGSARADYTEVLLTQRDAIESRFELVETKMQQLSAMVGAYRALGGGWK
ncbi:MAG: RND transporter [Cytophagaceae bacterium SCN 52-12]|nr:MAG: RND transporter [Cytophagaceae bacterium SCN 52-12]